MFSLFSTMQIYDSASKFNAGEITTAIVVFFVFSVVKTLLLSAYF